jgi:hypothetical protein
LFVARKKMSPFCDNFFSIQIIIIIILIVRRWSVSPTYHYLDFANFKMICFSTTGMQLGHHVMMLENSYKSPSNVHIFYKSKRIQ